MYIGFNDKGEVVGIKNAIILLEELPNKIANYLAINVSINSQITHNKQVLEIRVLKSQQPVSYHGKFYIRIGSTTQELKGHALQQLILQTHNLTWDEVICTTANLNDLDSDALKRFVRKAILKNRLPIDAESNNIQSVLKNLDLLNNNNELTRAAVLLFAKRPTKFVHNAVFKIGKFGNSSADLISHDIIEGPIIDMPEKIMDILKTKYLHSVVSYTGIERIETLEYPENALREAILNAIVHRNYATGTEITLSIFENKVVFWNDGLLMEPLNIEMLKKEHPSRKRNVLIATVFYRSGAIEAWGRGTKMMVDDALNGHFPEPIFREYAGGFEVTFEQKKEKDLEKDLKKDLEKDLEKDVILSENQKMLLNEIRKNGRITQKELSLIIGINEKNIRNNMNILKNRGIVNRVGPDKGGYWEVQNG
jgi:ATP-dependent DNA helicase RecG